MTDLAFSPVASCIVPYSDEYDTYAVFVDVDNKSDFYCLYDITVSCKNFLTIAC